MRRATSSSCCEWWMITAALPPSSSTTRAFRATACKARPTSAEPVKDSTARRGSAASPITSVLVADTSCTTPASAPACSRCARAASATPGAFGLGFHSTGQPASKAGAILCSARFSGKLNGVIASTGPAGRRCISAVPSSPRFTERGASRGSSSAVACSRATLRSTSSRARRSGLAVAVVMVRASAS